MKHKILIVDDEAANLRVLERLLRRQCEVVCAESGTEALELLRLYDVSLIISDQRMPGMSGIEFLKSAAVMRPHTVRLILTGYTDVNALVEAINSGVVYKYVTKPWVNEDLQQTVKRSLQHYETIKARHELLLQTERLGTRLRLAQEGFTKLVSEMLDFRAPHKLGHARRTRSYAVAIGKALNFVSRDLEQLSLAAFLHEVVDLYAPVERWSEKFSLTTERRATKKQDFERGLKLLEDIPDMNETISILRYSHEQWDGNGYPFNLRGEQIPLLTRVIAVADAYDDMTARQPLNHGLSHHEALERLQSEAGKFFDPAVVKVFCQLNSVGQTDNLNEDDGEGGEHHGILYESVNNLEYSQNSPVAEI